MEISERSLDSDQTAKTSEGLKTPMVSNRDQF